MTITLLNAQFVFLPSEIIYKCNDNNCIRLCALHDKDSSSGDMASALVITLYPSKLISLK